MHELSLAEHVLGLIEETAEAEGFHRVRRVVLEIGAFAAVEAEAMRFCFDVVARETIAAEAALDIIEIPGAGWCRDCRQAVALAEVFDACPACGGRDVELRSGRELKLKTLEVE
jgi:hydrogenase nickel incorporation protein HypA/HybF